jgi:transcriptional regulator with XRE-family HTH domain
MKNTLTTADVGRRIRDLRLALQLSMRECSSRAGIATSFLSKVESGRASPTMMTLQKILESLDTDLGTFFGEPAPAPDRPLVFPRAAMKLVKDRDRRWFFAFPRRRDIKATLTYEEYKPRTRTVESERHAHDVCGFVIEGELTLEVAGEAAQRARAGDAFYLQAGLPHVARNAGRTTLKMVVIQWRS